MLKSSVLVVDGTVKLVTPVGLSHTIEGGTKSSGQGSSAICFSSSGVRSFSEGGGKTGKGFDSFTSSESSKKRVEESANAPEENFIEAPTAIALGAGRLGKSFVLGSFCSKLPMREVIVSGKVMILKYWGTRGEQWSLISRVTSLLSKAKSLDRLSATAFSFPGNHWV